jgi:hypothetical protein
MLPEKEAQWGPSGVQFGVEQQCRSELDGSFHRLLAEQPPRSQDQEMNVTRSMLPRSTLLILEVT